MKWSLSWYLWFWVLLAPLGAQVLEEVQTPSASRLMDLLTDIYEATETFPDDRDEYTQLSIVNRNFNSCLAVLGRKLGNGGRLTLEHCFFTTIDSPELFWLRHVGQGFVTLATPWNKCVGGGRRSGAAVWTGDWCDQTSHHFHLVVQGHSGVQFVHRESRACITAVAEKHPVQMDSCSPLDPKQLWSVCVPSGNKCWPPAPPTVEPLAEVVGGTDHASSTVSSNNVPKR